ncbi:hypothetical protein FOBRF1_013711 [Fusarium oxysporum]
MPRPGQTSVPLEDIRRTLESLDRQHIDATTRLRRDARVQQVVESERQNEKRRMPLGEVTRTLEDLERRHIQDTAHRRQGAPLQTNPEPQTRNERHWVALEEILRISDDLDRRRAECQTGRPGPGLGRPHQAHRRREWVHTRVASGPASGPTTPEPASPLRTSPSLKRRSSQQDVLLAPPPSGRDRNRRKRPKLLHEGTGFADVEELLASMQPDANDDASPPGDSELVKESHQSPEDLLTSAPDPGSVDRGDDTVCETSASGMFPLDGPAAFAEADKLSFLTEALRTSQSRHDDDAEPSGMLVNTAGDQPFIRVERGADFADNLHEDFFPRTFPKLFPWGRGGPKALSLPDDNSYDALGSAQRSNNHSLNYWTNIL